MAQPVQAQSGGGVGAGPEPEAGVETDDPFAARTRQPMGFRYDEEAAETHRPETIAPGFSPVAIRNEIGFRVQTGERAEVGTDREESFHMDLAPEWSFARLGFDHGRFIGPAWK